MKRVERVLNSSCRRSDSSASVRISMSHPLEWKQVGHFALSSQLLDLIVHQEQPPRYVFDLHLKRLC